MKIVTPFTVLRQVVSDMHRMHDFSYKVPGESRKDYWDKECSLHPTSSNCKLYDD